MASNEPVGVAVREDREIPMNNPTGWRTGAACEGLWLPETFKDCSCLGSGHANPQPATPSGRIEDEVHVEILPGVVTCRPLSQSG